MYEYFSDKIDTTALKNPYTSIMIIGTPILQWSSLCFEYVKLLHQKSFTLCIIIITSEEAIANAW